MNAPKRRLTNHALRGREEWFKRIFRDQIAEAAGILEVVLSGIVLATIPAMTHGMLRDGIQTWLPTLMTQNFHFGTSASVALDIIIPVFNMLGVFFTKALPKKWTENELKASAAFFAVTIIVLIALDLVCNVSAVLSLILLTVASTCMTGANIMLINLIPVHFGVVGRASSVTGILNCSAYVGSAISSFGVGAVAPNPRKEREASSSIMVPISAAAVTTICVTMFGRTCTRRIFHVFVPFTTAASI